MELIKTQARMFALTVTVLAALVGAGLAGPHGPPPLSAQGMEQSASKFYLECPTQVTEGESFEAVLVREPADGYEKVNFGAWWHTASRYADENDYISLPGETEEMRWTTDAERASNRQPRTVVTLDDDDIEGDNFLWVSFTPTEQVVNPDHPSRDNKCMVIIRDNDPGVKSIDMVSSTARRDTYRLGETIEFAATFNHPVDVHGHPLMGFFMGDQWKGAKYQRGSGTDTLVFGYGVQPEDRDENGISIHDGYIDTDGRRHGFGGGGDIFIQNMPQVPGVDGFPVYKLYEGIPDQSDHKVDGSEPPRTNGLSVAHPADGDTFKLGEDIVLDITFTAPVRVLGTPLASFWFDGTGERVWRGAKYESGSGTDTLRFVYQVQPGDTDTDGLLVGYKGPQGLGEGTIKALDHDIDAKHTYHEFHPGFKVNGEPPFVTDVSMASTPAEGDTYRAGEIIEIDMNFSSPVEVSGEPALTLWTDTGDHARAAHAARYQSGSGTRTLRFAIEVPTTMNDANGLAIGERGEDGLGLGTITAAGTNVKADQSYPEQRNLSGHRVAGRPAVDTEKIAPAPVVGEPPSPELLLSHTRLEMVGGESATYTVALSTQPSEDVLVIITRVPDDLGDHAPLALPFLTMTFTPDNWNVPYEVAIVAEHDDDDLDHLIYLSHTAHGGEYRHKSNELSVAISDSNG